MRKRSDYDWVGGISGILLVLLGALMLIHPDRMLTWCIVLYGVLAVVLGVCDVIFYIRLAHFTGFCPILSLISGMMSVMCGMLLIATPDAGKWALTLLIPVWMIAHCIAGLAHMTEERKKSGFWVSLVMNILGLVLGILVLCSPVLSFLSLRVIVYLIAGYLVLLGVSCVFYSFS